MGYVQSDLELNFKLDIVDYSEFNLPIPTPPPLPPPPVKRTNFDEVPMEVRKLVETSNNFNFQAKLLTSS